MKRILTIFEEDQFDRLTEIKEAAGKRTAKGSITWPEFIIMTAEKYAEATA